MYLKSITLIFIFSINFIYCKEESFSNGIATQYGVTDGKWEVSDLQAGYCNIDYMKKKLKDYYNENIEDYLIIMNKKDISEDFKNNKEYDKDEEYFSPKSKTVALLNVNQIDNKDSDKDSDCGKLIEVTHKNKNKKYNVTLLVSDNCRDCKNDKHIDIPFETWNELYDGNKKKWYRINHKEGPNSPGEINVKWRFLPKLNK